MSFHHVPFDGNPNVTISAISTAGGIACRRTTGLTPHFCHVSASEITATGASWPYMDLEYQWDFGDPASQEFFKHPNTGLLVNSNRQKGPEAAHCYRNAGSYTITLTIRGRASGTYPSITTIEETVTQEVTVTAFNPSGGDIYIDAVDGSDSTGDGSIENPYQTIEKLHGSGFRPVSNCRINFKRGQVHQQADNNNPTMGAASELLGPARFGAYGEGRRPILLAAPGRQAFHINDNQGHDVDDVVISDLILTTNDGGSSILIIHDASTREEELSDFYIDNCEIYHTDRTDCSGTVTYAAEIGGGFWKTNIHHPHLDYTDIKESGISVYSTARTHYFVYGCEVSGGGGSEVLVHHFYAADTHGNHVMKWNSFGPGPGKNHVFKIDTLGLGGDPGEVDPKEYKDYLYYAENYISGVRNSAGMGNHQWGFDDVAYRNVIYEKNKWMGSDAGASFGISSTDSFTFRHNEVVRLPGTGTSYGWFFISNEPEQIEYYDNMTQFWYGNYFYIANGNDSPFSFMEAGLVAPVTITDNIVVNVTSDQCMKYISSEHVSAGSFFDRNTYYTPNSATPFDQNGTNISFAAHQALGWDTNSSTSDPGWIDPANGLFETDPRDSLAGAGIFVGGV